MFITFEDDKSVDQEEVKPTGDGARSEKQEPGFSRAPWSSHAILSGSENHKGWRIYAATGYPVAEVYPLNSDPSPAALANKRLITHGPDLYEAARYALQSRTAVFGSCEHETVVERCVECKLRAALALVDGPQNQETT